MALSGATGGGSARLKAAPVTCLGAQLAVLGRCPLARGLATGLTSLHLLSTDGSDVPQLSFHLGPTHTHTHTHTPRGKSTLDVYRKNGMGSARVRVTVGHTSRSQLIASSDELKCLLGCRQRYAKVRARQVNTCCGALSNLDLLCPLCEPC